MQPRENVDILFRAALQPDLSDDEYWDIIKELISVPGEKVLSTAIGFCDSADSNERVLGVQVLSQLDKASERTVSKIQRIFQKLLVSETEPSVLVAVCWGLNHLNRDFPVDSVLPLCRHSHPSVRKSVVGSLLGNESQSAIDALIELSGDSDIEVRSWATGGLGMMTNIDIASVREALVSRLSDEDEETRLEAVYGLAKRKDTRVTGHIIEQLQSKKFDANAVRAARNLGDAALIPYLKSLHTSWTDELNEIDKAIESCEKSN